MYEKPLKLNNLLVRSTSTEDSACSYILCMYILLSLERIEDVMHVEVRALTRYDR
jgi:hypothetical protein